MDTDRRCTSNSTTTTSSELFICFTSRLSSSSSMKISSKSILSPGRGRDSSQISLSTSLSRRLKSSGSIKGGGGQASPMFPAANGKKRGCNAFENPEPSSPKVTCIGQVRVKTKKQGKKMRGRSKSGRRDVSFRKTDQTPGGDAHFHQFQQQEQRNQRWVHLPVTICEALRTFGAEFNCFLPCRSSCMANNNHQRDKEEERGSNGGGDGSSSSTSCGAVFARWLVAEKIELVVGEKEEEEDDDDMMPRRSQRRHVFEDIVIEEAEKNEILDKEEEEGGRVSICIPPKNALLLMRCRSDPVKMAALANRFWECPPPPDEAEENNGGFVEEETHDQDKEMEQERIEDVVVCEKLDSLSHVVEEQIPEVEEEAEAEAEALPEVLLDREQVVIQEEEKKEVEDNQLVQGDLQKQDQEEDKEEVLEQAVLEEETFESASSPETFADPESEDGNEDFVENEAEAAPKQENEEALDEESEEEQEAVVAEETETLQKMLLHEEKEDEEETVTTTTTTHEPEEVEPETGQESKERESENKLPDCLLLMMCEPKLSMEVSKETWVCSTDFIRWHPPEKKPPPLPQPQPQPPQIVNKSDASDQPKKRRSIDLPPPAPQQIMQPPRSSCSFPAAPPLPTAPAHAAQSINTMVDQKLVGVKHSYEPFVLTRCKSEPMRSSAKLAPDACFWKNRKLEPHRPAATLGVGAAGVGF